MKDYLLTYLLIILQSLVGIMLLCLRVGARYKINCNNIINIDKARLKWRDEIRYLGVYITSRSVYFCF